jgi:very-short-patch-repair endonuclease
VPDLVFRAEIPAYLAASTNASLSFPQALVFSLARAPVKGQRMRMDRDRFMSTIRPQAGVFTRGQAISCGMHPREASRSIQRKDWVRVAGRGFVLVGSPVEMAQLAWAATLSVKGGVVWGPSAFKLWRPEAPLAMPHEVDVAIGESRPRQYRIRLRKTAVPAAELADWMGVPVQTPEMALADALAFLANRRADSLFAWAVIRNLASAEDLDGWVARRYSMPGAGRLRRYAAMWRSGAASQAEVLFHILMTEHGITGWRANAEIRLPNGNNARPDVLFDEARVVVEIDGWSAHGGRAAFQHDRTRQNDLVEAGYQILRFTWEDLTDRPRQCAERIKRLIGQRS